MKNKLDILVISAHPDDAELCCSGTIAKHIAQGYKVGLADLTKGEKGTRGTPEVRLKEASAAAEILGVKIRENLDLPDALFSNTFENQLSIIKAIRTHKPNIVLTNASDDRHPDHGKAAQLIKDACFYSGLRKIETFTDQQTPLEAWRPKAVFHYIQDRYLEPDFVVDITPFWNIKLASIKAFKSQFFDPNNQEPESYISTQSFFEFIEGRAKEMGHKVGVSYGEGFIKAQMISVNDLTKILG